MRSILLATAFVTGLSGVAAASTLNALPATGETVTVGDVVFSNFVLTDERSSVFPGDDMPTTDEIKVHTSSTSNSVTITFDFEPAVSVSGLSNGFETIFSFSLDFDATISGSSSRTFSTLELSTPSDGILTADDAFAEVDTRDAIGSTLPNFILLIGDDTSGEVTSDDSNLAAGLTSLSLFNFIDGESKSASASATLNRFSLTLTLAGTPPGPDGVVPLPAGLPLLASALAFGVIALRRKKAS